MGEEDEEVDPSPPSAQSPAAYTAGQLEHILSSRRIPLFMPTSTASRGGFGRGAGRKIRASLAWTEPEATTASTLSTPATPSRGERRSTKPASFALLSTSRRTASLRWPRSPVGERRSTFAPSELTFSAIESDRGPPPVTQTLANPRTSFASRR